MATSLTSEVALSCLCVNTANLQGELYTPGDTSGYWPAIVIMNSSAGVCDTRERFYARFFAAQGVASMVVDSFQARGISQTITNQSQLTDQDMERDAYAAYEFLAANPQIDAGRVGIMGVSRGGLAALNTALLARRQWFGRPAQDFAARVAVVPPAYMQQRDARSDGRPSLFLLAGLDDYTRVEAARTYASRIAGAGNPNIHVVVYPEAYHAWERTGAPIFLAEAENYSQCRMSIENDTTLTDEQSGRHMTMEEFFRDRNRYRVLGGHAGGGTEEFKLKAAGDILDFFVSQTNYFAHP